MSSFFAEKNLCLENHSLGEWFIGRLLSIMKTEKLPLLYNRSEVWQLHKIKQWEGIKRNDVHSLSHTSWNCEYHIVFAPKYRRKVFYGQKRKEIGEILRKLCEWKKVNIIEAEVCPDDIHMLVEIPPKYSVSCFMGYLKGKSSLMIYEKYPELKYKYRNREFWCRGYYVDAVDLGSNFIGEVCRQTLYRFQNGTMQFFFRDGRRAAAEFRSVLDAVHAPPDDLFSAVDIPSRPLVRAAAVTAEQSLGQGILAVVMSIKKRHFLPPQHLTSSFPAATVAFFLFIVSTLQQSARPGTAVFQAKTGTHISNS